MNWKKEQQKLPNLNNTEKTNEYSLRDLWGCDKKKFTLLSLQSWNDKERGGENGTQGNIMAENLPNLARDKPIEIFKKLSKPQTGYTQRNQCQDTSIIKFLKMKIKEKILKGKKKTTNNNHTLPIKGKPILI